MYHLANAAGRAAVPDAGGGIRFVPSEEAPQNVPWGRYEYATNRGLPCVAYGPQPPAGATQLYWTLDDTKARQVCAAPARPVEQPAPADRLKEYDRRNAELVEVAHRLAPAPGLPLPITEAGGTWWHFNAAYRGRQRQPVAGARQGMGSIAAPRLRLVPLCSGNPEHAAPQA